MKKSDYFFIAMFLVVILMSNSRLIEGTRTRWKTIEHKIKVESVDKIEIGKDEPIYRNESNLNNVGSILETEEHDYIVYDHNNLVKANKNSDEKLAIEVPTQRYGIGSMQVYGEWLFYTAKGIHRINVDGTRHEQLFSGWVTDMYVTPQGIYFLNGKDKSKLYRMDINGQQFECLSKESYRDLLLDENKFYGTLKDDEYRDLVSLDMEGQIIEVIKSGIAAGGMIKQDDFIYYRDQNTQYLKRWNLETNSPELLVAKEITHFALDDSFIYYSERDPSSLYGDTKGLSRLDISTSETIVLDDKTERTVGEVQILRDYVYIESDFKEASFGFIKIKKDGSERKIIKP